MEIFFYLPNKMESAIHSYVCLAEGFAQLGIKSYSTYDHCLRNVAGDDYLIRYDESHPMENADIVFIHYSVYQQLTPPTTSCRKQPPDADKPESAQIQDRIY